ncbi:MAG: PqqD family peptide modification chaperone [Magnetovibrio sp.]|nr:PqqD family peptide modification chaperone [Magnetovibrio sp.]
MHIENVYPVIAIPYVLHLTPHEGYLRDVSVMANVHKGDTHMLNDVATDLLSRCDGQTTVASLLQAMAARYEGEGFDMGHACRDYFAEMVDEGLLDLHSTPIDGSKFIRGSRDYECPSHFMIELTDQCNLRCAHCYRNSTPQCQTQIPTPKLLAIIDEMCAHGVSTIELTGGEPTMRGNFMEIFHHCAPRFNSVAVITNGWFITDAWARQMAEYDNIIVQVDWDESHGAGRDTLRGRDGSFERSSALVGHWHNMVCVFASP